MEERETHEARARDGGQQGRRKERAVVGWREGCVVLGGGGTTMVGS